MAARRAAPTERASRRSADPGLAGEPLVEVRDLVKHFPITRGVIVPAQVGAVQAVDGVSFDVRRGETLGLVGETGCGKSTTARLIMRLLDADRGRGPLRRPGHHARCKGARAEGDPARDADDLPGPVLVAEPAQDGRLDHRRAVRDPRPADRTRASAASAVQELMETVGLNPEHYNRYPHEFSGGQRQRIGVARALALKPKLLVADEPVSALDVSIQAQVLNLLRDLQRELGLTLIFIAHDLSVVRHMCDRVAVMYLGKIVEIGAGDALYEFPRHPYTGALLSAVPVADPSRHGSERRLLTGDVPSPANPPSACRFHTRCPKAQAPLLDRGAAARGQGHGHARRLPLPAHPRGGRRRSGVRSSA